MICGSQNEALVQYKAFLCIRTSFCFHNLKYLAVMVKQAHYFILKCKCWVMKKLN